MKRRIIISDSDRQSARLLKTTLSSAGYEISSASGFRECYPLISAFSPDILIVDPLYPGKDGLNLIKSLKEQSGCTVIAVSAVAGERAVTETLDAGADDYIKKPFYSAELLARVRTAVRHLEQLEAAKGTASSDCYSCGGLTVEYDRRAAFMNGERVRLTKNEFRILALLCRSSGKVLTYDFIIKSIWGTQVSGGNGILRVNVTNLRKKIEQDSLHPLYLFTENGVGYRMSENESFPHRG